jgi:hypothetical protein
LATAHDSIAYITNPLKTNNGELVTSFRCSPDTAHLEMLMMQKEYEQQKLHPQYHIPFPSVSL